MDSNRHVGHLSFRQAAGTDAPAIRRILWETWVATYGLFIPMRDMRSYFEEHYNEEAIKELLREPGVEGHIADCGKVTAGVMITRRNESEGRFYVSSLYVLPEFQGHGIGKALLARAEELALAAGMRDLWLGVMIQNLPALAWYRSLGFSFIEELPFQMGETTVTHLIGSMALGTHSG